MVEGSASFVSKVSHTFKFKLKWRFHFIGGQIAASWFKFIHIQLMRNFDKSVLIHEGRSIGEGR